MNVKRVAVVSLITFFIGAVGGGVFAFLNHPINGGSGSASLAEDLKQAHANREVQQFINEQEKLHPDGLGESSIETGSKYTGITYNGENNSVVIATPQKEQGDMPMETTPQNPAVQDSVSKGRVAIQEGSLNVRGQASTDGAILGQVYKGDTVEILGQNGAWYQIVTSSGIKGYVSATYIEVIQ